MAAASVPPLLPYLRPIPDPRQASGRRHPLAAILALACAAMLAGCDSLLAIAEWGRDPHAGAPLAQRLGFTRERTPCVATLHRVFKRLDVAAFETAVGAWAAAVTSAVGPGATPGGIAVDGKVAARQSPASGAGGASPGRRRAGPRAGAHRSADRSGHGRGGGAAGTAGRARARRASRHPGCGVHGATGGRGDPGQRGHYLMPVKANQPQLLEDLARLFADPALVAATGTAARTVDKGHGRLEVRRLWTSTALVGYSDWPGLAQALCLEREVVRLNTGEVRRERVYAVTSLAPEQAMRRSPAAVARPLGHREPAALGARRRLRRGSIGRAGRGRAAADGRDPQHRHRPAAGPRLRRHRRHPPRLGPSRRCRAHPPRSLSRE